MESIVSEERTILPEQGPGHLRDRRQGQLEVACLLLKKTVHHFRPDRRRAAKDPGDPWRRSHIGCAGDDDSDMWVGSPEPHDNCAQTPAHRRDGRQVRHVIRTRRDQHEVWPRRFGNRQLALEHVAHPRP